MNDSSNWLKNDHHKYDALLYKCELAADVGDWDNAKSLFDEFVSDVKLHMQMEDEVLYPLFVEMYGDKNGDIESLSEEHDFISHLVHDLAHVIKQDNLDHFLTSLEPLHEALNRHNKHEEKIFLSMESHSLVMRREEVMERLNALDKDHGGRVWDI